jgi:predicted amidophosphoribosyltransferase
VTTLTVYHFVHHFTMRGAPWVKRDFDANDIVSIIKQRAWSRYLDIRMTDNTVHRFTPESGEKLVPYICEAVAAHLARAQPQPFTFVPVPNSSACFGGTEEFRTLALARQIAAGIGDTVQVCAALRWKEPKDTAHQGGGTRDPQKLYEKLTVVQPLPAGRLALFDDVRTTGGSLVTAYRKLRDHSKAPVFACTLVRASQEPQTRLASWTVDQLDVDEEAEFG